MNLRKRYAALIATGVAGAMALTACGGDDNGGGGGDQAQGGRVVYGESTDWPENFFPFISAGNALSTGNIEAQVFPQAYRIQPDLTVTYDQDLLASEPVSEVNGDTQTITYKINPDAVWSDNTPITADDFEFTWRLQRSSDPASGGCPALLSTVGYDQVKSVEGSDNGKTVTLTVSPPYGDWQSLYAGNSNPLMPKHVLDKPTPEELCTEITEGWPLADGIPQDISGGPWQVKKENIDVGGQIVVLTPNENYWGEKPKLSQLIIQGVGNDPTTLVQGVQSGELGSVYPQPQLDMVDQIRALEPNVSNEINFGLTFEHLDFNTQDKHLGDVNVRRAFAMALDRQEIVDQTVGQFSSDAQVLDNRIWMTNQPEYKDTAPDQYKQQNVEQAKQLLQQAGYTPGPDGIMTHPQRGRLTIQIDTTESNPLRQTTIEVMIPQLKEAGIDATFNANPDIFAGKDKPTSLEAGGFQAALFAWVSSPFVTSAQAIYQTPQGENIGQNYSRIGNPQVDQLFTQLATTPDHSEQARLGNEIDTLLWDQVATVPLYQKPTFMVWQSSISGPKDNPSLAGPLWNGSAWSVKQ